MKTIDASDIKTSIIERMAQEQLGVPADNLLHAKLFIATLSKLKRAKLFQKAYTDYLAEKLPDTEENKFVINEPIYIMQKLSTQFSWEGDKDAFYKQCIHCILDAYSDISGTKLEWHEVPMTSQGDYPKFDGQYFISIGTHDTYDTAVWLYNAYNEKTKEIETYQKTTTQKTKGNKKANYMF